MTSALPSTTLSVDPAWIDEYGHMNAAHYVGIFDRVGFQLLREVGVGLDYTEATRCGIYTMNVHVAYLREVLAGDPLALRIRLLEADDKRLLCLMELMQTRDGYVAATMEQLSLHVDLETRRQAVPAGVGAAAGAHGRRARRPAAAGRLSAALAAEAAALSHSG